MWKHLQIIYFKRSFPKAFRPFAQSFKFICQKFHDKRKRNLHYYKSKFVPHIWLQFQIGGFSVRGISFKSSKKLKLLELVELLTECGQEGRFWTFELLYLSFWLSSLTGCGSRESLSLSPSSPSPSPVWPTSHQVILQYIQYKGQRSS